MEISRYPPDPSAGEVKEEPQPCSSGANRIALVHPQRNGNKESDCDLAELTEQTSHSGSHFGVLVSGEEDRDQNLDSLIPHDYELGEDSDTASSCPGQESSRLRPEGQSQGRPPKTTPVANRTSTAPTQDSCVNDTDFYESDSESRGQNILV